MLWKPSEPSCQARLSSALRFQSLQARWMITSCPREMRSVPSASGASIALPPGLSVIESTWIRGSAESSRATARSSRPLSAAIRPRLVTSSAATTKAPGCPSCSRSVSVTASAAESTTPRSPKDPGSAQKRRSQRESSHLRFTPDFGRAVGVEALDRVDAPELTATTLLLRPHNRLEVRVVDEVAAGRHLDPVSSRLVDVDEEALSDRVLRGRRLDVDAVVDEEVGRAEALLARVHPEGEVVEPAAGAVHVGDVDQLVRRDREAEPRARLGAIVELDPLVQAVPEHLLRELAVPAHVRREHVDVVEPLDRGAPADVALRLVAPRGPEVLGRLGAPRPQRQVSESGLRRLGELEAVTQVVAPAAQEDGLSRARLLLHAEYLDEEAEALLGLRRQQLGVADPRQIVEGLGHESMSCRRPSRSYENAPA